MVDPGGEVRLFGCFDIICVICSMLVFLFVVLGTSLSFISLTIDAMKGKVRIIDAMRRYKSHDSFRYPAVSDNEGHPHTSELIARLAKTDEVVALLDGILSLASSKGLQIDAGSYELQKTESRVADEYIMSFSATGPYVSIQKFLLEAQEQYPALILDKVSFSRESIGAARLEARVQFALLVK